VSTIAYAARNRDRVRLEEAVPRDAERPPEDGMRLPLKLWGGRPLALSASRRTVASSPN